MSIRTALFAVASSCLLIQPAISQPIPDPTSVVHQYTQAANDGDLEAFLALYHPEIRKYRFPDKLTSEGIAHNRAAYQRSFNTNPNLHVEIVEMIRLGNKIVVHDRVTGLGNGKTSDELTIYEVEGNQIRNIVYVERIER